MTIADSKFMELYPVGSRVTGIRNSRTYVGTVTGHYRNSAGLNVLDTEYLVPGGRGAKARVSLTEGLDTIRKR